MKIKGEKLHLVFRKDIVIPGNTPEESVHFIAEAKSYIEDFNKLCPEPEPGRVGKPGESKLDTTNPTYLKKLDEWQVQRFDYMILRSLEPTPGLEWETVDMKDPKTWGNYRTELREAGFSEQMINQLVLRVAEVHNVTAERIDEATQNFLAGQEAQ